MLMNAVETFFDYAVKQLNAETVRVVKDGQSVTEIYTYPKRELCQTGYFKNDAFIVKCFDVVCKNIGFGDVEVVLVMTYRLSGAAETDVSSVCSSASIRQNASASFSVFKECTGSCSEELMGPVLVKSVVLLRGDGGGVVETLIFERD